MKPLSYLKAVANNVKIPDPKLKKNIHLLNKNIILKNYSLIKPKYNLCYRRQPLALRPNVVDT